MRHRFEGHLIHKRWVAEHSFGNYQRVKMFVVEDGHRRTGRLAPHRPGEALVMRMRPKHRRCRCPCQPGARSRLGPVCGAVLSSAGDGCGRPDWDLASTELLWTAKCVVSTVGRPEPVVGCDRGC